MVAVATGGDAVTFWRCEARRLKGALRDTESQLAAARKDVEALKRTIVIVGPQPNEGQADKPV